MRTRIMPDHQHEAYAADQPDPLRLAASQTTLLSVSERSRGFQRRILATPTAVLDTSLDNDRAQDPSFTTHVTTVPAPNPCSSASIAVMESCARP